MRRIRRSGRGRYVRAGCRCQWVRIEFGNLAGYSPPSQSPPGAERSCVPGVRRVKGRRRLRGNGRRDILGRHREDAAGLRSWWWTFRLWNWSTIGTDRALPSWILRGLHGGCARPTAPGALPARSVPGLHPPRVVTRYSLPKDGALDFIYSGLPRPWVVVCGDGARPARGEGLRR